MNGQAWYRCLTLIVAESNGELTLEKAWVIILGNSQRISFVNNC